MIEFELGGAGREKKEQRPYCSSFKKEEKEIADPLIKMRKVDKYGIYTSLGFSSNLSVSQLSFHTNGTLKSQSSVVTKSGREKEKMLSFLWLQGTVYSNYFFFFYHCELY